MTFLQKKFHGSLQIDIIYDLFFVKLKSGQKKFKKILIFFPNEKPSKMTFLPKKFQGSLQIGITFDLFFVKLKLGQKNSDQILIFFQIRMF